MTTPNKDWRKKEIIAWMNKGIPDGKTIPDFESMLDDFLTSHTTELIERIEEIVTKENYELEEWYSSAERSENLTHFEANQKNMETRNKITAKLKQLKQERLLSN